MRFIKPNSISNCEISQDLLDLGVGFELIHSSTWPEDEGSILRGCWSRDLEPSDLIRMVLDKATSTVLQSSDEDFAADVRGWLHLRQNPEAYFADPVRTLLPEGRDYEKWSLQRTDQKEDTRDWILNYASRHGNDGCAESIQAIFEELFMNALIDAPRESGKTDHREATFFMGCDDRRMAIACRDGYGSLNATKLLKRMQEVYQKGAGEAINLRGPGGAGLGCTIMMERSSLVCFGVKPLQATVVTCLVHRNVSQRRRSEFKKSLHLTLNE